MENGIGFEGYAKLEERNGGHDEEPKPNGRENIHLNLDGSKASDDEEQFVEAVEAKTPVGIPEITIITQEKESELIGTLGNDEVNPDEFHESVATPSVLSSEYPGVQSEILMSEDNRDNKEIAVEEILRGETNGLMDEIIAESNDNDVKDENSDCEEIVKSTVVSVEIEKLDDENDKLEKSKEPEDKKMSFLEALVSGNTKVADADNKEELDLEKLGNPDSVELTIAEVDRADKSPDTAAEPQNGSEVEGDATSCIPENGASVHEDSLDSMDHERVKSEYADVLGDHIHETSVTIEDQIGEKEGTADIRSESESIEDAFHDKEQNTTLGSGYQQDKHEIDSVNLHQGIKGQTGEEEKESGISSADLKDDETSELKMVDLEVVQCDKVDTKHVDQQENISAVASDDSGTDHGGETNLHSAIDDSSVVKEIPEVCPKSSSPELLPKDFSFPQPNLTDFSAGVSTKINDRPEEGGDKDEKPEASLFGSKKQEDRPSIDISSSLGNSSTTSLSPAHPASYKDDVKLKEPVSQDTTTNTAQESQRPIPIPSIDISSSLGTSSTTSLSSAHPASFKDDVKLKEPVSQDTTTNTAQESKPAAEITSSAKSTTTRSTGVGLNVSPLDPTPKNSRSRSVADTPSTNSNSAPPARPAGLGRAAPLLEPSSRVVQQPRANGAASATQNQLIEDPTNGEAEEYDETREKLQMIRVKFLRLAHRLGQTPHNVVVAQVLYRLGLAEQLHGRSGGRGGTFSFDRASAMAEQLEAAGQEPLDFTCTIMVLGKSGGGKSATINSIFDEVFFGTDAFELGTKKVQDIVGTVQGIRVRVIDTPGLLPSWSDQRENEKILHSVKKFIKKTPPDIVLYLDRLDMQSRDFGDMPLLRTITETFGPSIWFNAIVVLTHAASAPPEGPNGTATSYDMFVTQRSHVVQQAIRQAAGDTRLMNPVSLVENHSACRTNRAGQRVLPNGQVWKPHLLLLSFASKILAEANTLLKLQDTPPGRPYAPRTRSPPLPFLLSSILQSRPEVKLPSEQFGGEDDDDIDDDLDESFDSDEDSEYDELPPFKPLTKAQLEKLNKVQRKAYYDELEYREKLFMKKQLKEERKQRKMMKKMREAAKSMPADFGDNGEEESSAAASVPVPMPDLALPASFDADNPTHRYRSLDSSNPWLVRAVLEPNGWDHDIGYDGINVERLFVVKEKVPVSFSGHISKDKKDANLQMEIASSVKHGKGKATSMGFDMQSVGKDYAYTLRSETRFSNHRINKATAGLSATVLGDVVTGGLKLEDKLIIGKRGQIVVSAGGIYGRGEVAYGGSLEATLRDKDHPLGRFLSTFGLSIMDWHGDVAIGCNSQTQIPIGRHTNLIGRFNLNNRGSGQFSIKVNSSEQLQIVLVGLVPLVKKILGYSQQSQYGY